MVTPVPFFHRVGNFQFLQPLVPPSAMAKDRGFHRRRCPIVRVALTPGILSFRLGTGEPNPGCTPSAQPGLTSFIYGIWVEVKLVMAVTDVSRSPLSSV